MGIWVILPSIIVERYSIIHWVRMGCFDYIAYMSDQSLSVGFIIFDDMELLDFAGPFELFAASNEVAGDTFFDLRVYGFQKAHHCYRGPEMVAAQGHYQNGSATVWVIPGGEGSKFLAAHQNFLEWLQTQFEAGHTIISICSGARVLAAAGLLASQPYTTHPLVVEELVERVPSGKYVSDQPFVSAREERIWTTGAVVKGMEWALHFLSQYRNDPHLLSLKKYLGWSY
jgi:transcriptional regulator GlxA family with amidase domain